MKTTTLPAGVALLLPLILGVAIAAITYATYTGKSLPMIASPKAAIIAMLVIGMTMCTVGGIGQVGASGKWASPLAILGYLLGAAILVVLFSGLFGWKLPMVATPKDAVLAGAALMVVKYVIGTLSYLFHLL